MKLLHEEQTVNATNTDCNILFFIRSSLLHFVLIFFLSWQRKEEWGAWVLESESGKFALVGRDWLVKN